MMFGVFVFEKVFVFIVAIIYSMYLFMLNSVLYCAPFDKASLAVLCIGNLGWVFIMLYTYILCFSKFYSFLKKWEKAILVVIVIIGTFYMVNLSCGVMLELRR